jgi:hypothetical protein
MIGPRAERLVWIFCAVDRVSVDKTLFQEGIYIYIYVFIFIHIYLYCYIAKSTFICKCMYVFLSAYVCEYVDFLCG